jgi:hypothetical protein
MTSRWSWLAGSKRSQIRLPGLNSIAYLGDSPFLSLTRRPSSRYVVALTNASQSKTIMKPTANLHRLPVIDSWQRQPQMKNALLQRIRTITSEIHSIQAEMHGELTEPASSNKLASFFDDGNAVQLLNDFKAELDQLRRILWFYIEHASAQETATDADQQVTRLQRVNELLLNLSPRPAAAAATGEAIKPAVSFFERLDLVMDTYMQKEKKPVAHSKAAKAGH